MYIYKKMKPPRTCEKYIHPKLELVLIYGIKNECEINLMHLSDLWLNGGRALSLLIFCCSKPMHI